MIRLSILASMMVVLCAALIAGVNLVSKNGSTLPANLDTYQCSPQPCWHNIFIGKTRYSDAYNTLHVDSSIKITQFSEQDICWASTMLYVTNCLSLNTDGVVVGINLWVDTPLRLGDAVAIFGQPQTVQTCWMATANASSEPPMFIYMYYPNGMEIISSSQNPFLGGQLTPDQRVGFISYASIEKAPPDIPAWHGFNWLGEMPNSRFC